MPSLMAPMQRCFLANLLMVIYPVESVAAMARIDEYTEAAMMDQDAFALKEYSNKNVTEAVGQSVAHTARNLRG